MFVYFAEIIYLLRSKIDLLIFHKEFSLVSHSPTKLHHSYTTIQNNTFIMFSWKRNWHEPWKNINMTATAAVYFVPQVCKCTVTFTTKPLHFLSGFLKYPEVVVVWESCRRCMKTEQCPIDSEGCLPSFLIGIDTKYLRELMKVGGWGKPLNFYY